MKKVATLLLSMAMAFTMVACSNTTEPEAPATDEGAEVVEPEATERVVTVTDMSGDQVTITGEVETIINLWPAGTSSFFVMGAGDMVEGLAVNNAGTINAWSELFYSGARNIPALGGTTPTVEELINLDPDLVIIHPSSASSGYAQQIRDAGIPAVNINFNNYDTMIQAYSMLGEILGGEYQEKLTQWCNMVQAKQTTVKAATATIADADKPVVYYIAGQNDSLTVTMGSNSICADWTRMAGGVYATDLIEGQTGTEVTAEEIFALDPDIIIVGGVYQHTLIEQLQTTDGWKDLKAVQNGNVYGNPYGAFNWDRFGLESYLQMDYALLRIQPEAAAAAGVSLDSIASAVKSFYQLMNGITLTDAQVEAMLNGLNPDGSMPATQAAGAGPAAGQSGTR